MRRLVLLLYLVLMVYAVQAQTKRALIVGIGDYPAESGWSKIHGNNDVPIVRNALISRNFISKNIQCLVNAEATKKNIISGLSHLISQATTGDVVYLHFSTHGQQVTDTNGDESDGLDEAIIPYDAKKEFVKGVYEGENHLIDDELNRYLTQLRKKIGTNGSLLVVIDACHSGDATRGDNNETDSVAMRGTQEVFKIEAQSTKFKGASKELGWVVISATQTYQNNYEYKLNGEYYGSLSYAVKLALDNFSGSISYSEFFDRITSKRAEMNVSRYPQRPMIDGDTIYKSQKAF